MSASPDILLPARWQHKASSQVYGDRCEGVDRDGDHNLLSQSYLIPRQHHAALSITVLGAPTSSHRCWRRKDCCGTSYLPLKGKAALGRQGRPRHRSALPHLEGAEARRGFARLQRRAYAAFDDSPTVANAKAKGCQLLRACLLGPRNIYLVS